MKHFIHVSLSISFPHNGLNEFNRINPAFHICDSNCFSVWRVCKKCIVLTACKKKKKKMEQVAVSHVARYCIWPLSQHPNKGSTDMDI